MRAADAILRALGGAEVTLLFPLSTGVTTGSDLGQGDLPVEQVTVSPVCSLPPMGDRTGRKREFLFPASSISALVEASGGVSAEAWFESAVGIVHEGRLLRIESVFAEIFSGTAYLYRVTTGE